MLILETGREKAMFLRFRFGCSRMELKNGRMEALQFRMYVKAAPSLTITESGYTGVTQDAFTAYCKVSGTKPVARVEYSAWNIAFSTEKTVTKQGSISGGYSQCSFSISEFGWRTGA